MAKLQVLLDEEFNVIGTAQTGTVKISDGEEITAQLSPLSGQHVVEIDVPDDVASLQDGAKLHATLRTMM